MFSLIPQLLIGTYLKCVGFNSTKYVLTFPKMSATYRNTKNRAMLSIGTLMKRRSTPARVATAKTRSVVRFFPRGATRNESRMVRTPEAPE